MNKNDILVKNSSCLVRVIKKRRIIVGAKQFIEINIMGEEVWKLIDGRTFSDILDELKKDYDVDYKILERDVDSFLEILLEKGAIEKK